ncbi:glycosyltransferase family 2 protein [Candidatus Nitrospira bockiana]
MPLVTAIIPAYNGLQRYLDRAILSVLKQCFTNVELIVVDDASTDDTGELVRRYSEARYVRLPSNHGQAAARNHGASLARGEFLAFLDQDDIWEPSFVEETLKIFSSSPGAALVHTDGYQVTEDDQIVHYDRAMKPMKSVTQLLRGNHDTATSGSLIRAACFHAVGGYDESLAVWEDIDLGIRLYQRFPVVHLPKPLYRHRLYQHNASREIPSERTLMARRRFLEKHSHTCLPGSAEERALRRDWAHYYGDLGKHYLRNGQTARARDAFRLSVHYYPFSRKSLFRLIGSYLPMQSRAAP